VIDFSMEEMLELARQAELQKRVEADGVEASKPEPVILPEDLRGKFGEAEEEGRAGGPAADTPEPGN
jgi:hypothetical protein